LSIDDVRDGLDELVDTREELGAPPSRSYGLIVVDAQANSNCSWDDCDVRRIRVGDAIAKHPDHPDLGFVHAEHYTT
jgi:hypothetical protein